MEKHEGLIPCDWEDGITDGRPPGCLTVGWDGGPLPQASGIFSVHILNMKNRIFWIFSCRIAFWFVTSCGTMTSLELFQRGWQMCYSWGANALDSIICVLMICNVDRTYPDLVFPQIHSSVIRQNAFYFSDKVSCMKKYRQEFSVSYCKSFGSDVLPTH